MGTRPLLVFPTREASDRSKRTSGWTPLHYPSAPRQVARLTPQIENIEAAFAAGRAELRAQVAGTEPEKVLVLETVGSIEDFMNAVRRIEGMEWMAELEEDIAPDEDFFVPDQPDKPIGGRLFLVLTNGAALNELLRLWRAYQRQPEASFAYGFGKWRSLFRQLRVLRLWNAEDRLRETGLLEAWQEDLAHGDPLVRFEAELWFRQNPVVRERAIRELTIRIEGQGGRVVSQAAIPAIAYHAAIGEIPAAAAELVIREVADVRLLHCEQVMFFRPVGQSAAPNAIDEPAAPVATQGDLPTEARPIAALLDGLPVENHELLAGRLVVDDPDNWTEDYPTNDRQHGTAMASLIAHGDLGREQAPLDTRIYVRPIMRPDERDWRDPRVEAIPRNSIPADLIHRAVRRMFEPDGNNPPAAPSVRVVNISIGNAANPYERIVSPFARILDWLSWRYRILFVVSAGNQLTPLNLGLRNDEVRAAGEDVLAQHVFRAIATTAHIRRVLSPAESINSVTVGATHEDESGAIEAHRINPYAAAGFPSPLNAVGSGFRRSVKPEVLCEGGRQMYTLAPTPDGAAAAALYPERSQGRAPGQRTASPGPAGDLGRTRYSRGTSNAAAIATRHAVAISGMLDELVPALDADSIPVTTKCLLVHSCAWNDAAAFLRPLVEEMNPEANIREQLARFMGYGKVDVGRVLACTEHRATIIGTGDLGDGEGHVYSVPLPPSLSGLVGRRRLTVTLAWFSPINPLHRGYRSAALWFEAPDFRVFQLSRLEGDHRAVQRGTAHHEIFEGERAVPFLDGTSIRIKVNCRADAKPLPDRVPYALAVTLEAAEELAVAIYDEVRVRLAVPVPIRAAGPQP
jgi:hypothetical protein